MSSSRRARSPSSSTMHSSVRMEKVGNSIAGVGKKMSVVSAAIAGVGAAYNASGKTSVLKVINLALSIVKNEPVNHVESKSILGATEKATICNFWYNQRDYHIFDGKRSAQVGWIPFGGRD